jgi:hypothetical protein
MHKSQDNALLCRVRLVAQEQTMRTNHDGTISVHIPITFRKHGGRKYIISADTVPDEYKPPKESDSILKAIGQAFLWKQMIDSGEVTSTADLALKLKMNESYTGRVLRLTLLAPDIVEAIVAGRQPKHLTLRDFLKPVPHDWDEQRQQYGFTS